MLHELLGQPNVKNYDGSWTEYGSLVGVPIELGDEPGAMCGADQRRQVSRLEGLDLAKEAVIQGVVTRDGEPGRRRLRAAARLVRRVHRRGPDVGDRASSGSSRRPGTWTVRTLAPRAATVDRGVVAEQGDVAEVAVDVAASPDVADPHSRPQIMH